MGAMKAHFASEWVLDLTAIAPVAMLAAVLALRATAQEPEPVTLEPLTVTAPVAPLDRSLYLLRLLVEQTTPCLGCDAVLVAREPAALKLLDYLLFPPDRLDEAARLAREIKLQDSPDLEYLRR